jgi:hypothetical protein
MQRDSLILILLLSILIIYTYHSKFEKFDTENSQNQNVPQKTISLDSLHKEEKIITKLNVKFKTDDDYYLKFFKFPMTEILTLTVSNVDDDMNTIFILEGNYIKDLNEYYIKVNTGDPKKLKLSNNLLLENDQTNTEFWTPLLYNSISRSLYYEKNLLTSNLYNKCYLKVSNADVLPNMSWAFCDPKNLPILSSESTRFDVINL